MSYLVGNLEDRFSHNEAHFYSPQIQQGLLDKATPHASVRWVVTLLLFALYFLRVYFLQVSLKIAVKNDLKVCLKINLDICGK